MSIEGNTASELSAEEAREEKLKRELTRGIAYALAPVVRAVSSCPVNEFANAPFDTIRTVLADMELLGGEPAGAQAERRVTPTVADYGPDGPLARPRPGRD